MKLSLFVLRCRDIEASKEFYALFGCQFKEEMHGSGPKHYSCTHNNLTFELYPMGKSATTDNVRLGFKVKNMRDTFYICRDNDVTIEKNTHERDGEKLFIVVDPDGRKVEITE